MSSPVLIHFAAGMHSDAVSNATGKGWHEWFSLLDTAGAGHLPHKEIERYLHETQGLSGWWSRRVTIGYEQACGKRRVRLHEKSYTINATRSFDVDVVDLFKAWADDRRRAHWLPANPILIRKAIPHRNMRINWSDGESGLVVRFMSVGAGKSGLVVDHVNLASEAQANAQREFWSSALSRLARHLKGEKC